MPGRRRPSVPVLIPSYVALAVALRPAARFDVVGAGVAPTSLLLRREYRPLGALGWMLRGPSRSPERCRPYGTEQNATVAGTPGGNVETNAQSRVVAGSPLQFGRGVHPAGLVRRAGISGDSAVGDRSGHLRPGRPAAGRQSVSSTRWCGSPSHQANTRDSAPSLSKWTSTLYGPVTRGFIVKPSWGVAHRRRTVPVDPS